MRNKINILLVLSALVLFGCKDQQGYSKINKETPEAVNTVHKIVVNEFLNAGGYTYINVNEEDEDYWMAIPNTTVEKGAAYYYTGGMVMKDFESKELEKTFDFIIFSEGLSTSEEGMEQVVTDPHASANATESIVSGIIIDKAKNGVSVEELYAKKESFLNKDVIVRGKVVKVNNGIMDRNWVHIVDGNRNYKRNHKGR